MSILTCAVMVWLVGGGAVMGAAAADRTLKFLLIALVVLTLADIGTTLFRQVRPVPNRRILAR